MLAQERVRAAKAWRTYAGVTHDLVPDRKRQPLDLPTGSGTKRREGGGVERGQWPRAEDEWCPDVSPLLLPPPFFPLSCRFFCAVIQSVTDMWR